MKIVVGAVVALLAVVFMLSAADCYKTGGRPVRGWFGGIECVR